MAKKGMNVLLISRTEAKLVDAETEIKAACPSVEVAHLAIDYSNFDATLQVSDVERQKIRHTRDLFWMCTVNNSSNQQRVALNTGALLDTGVPEHALTSRLSVPLRLITFVSGQGCCCHRRQGCGRSGE